MTDSIKLIQLLQDDQTALTAVETLQNKPSLINEEIAIILFVLLKCDKELSASIRPLIKKTDKLPKFLGRALSSRKSYFNHAKDFSKFTHYRKFKYLEKDWGLEACSFLSIEMCRKYGYPPYYNFLDFDCISANYQKALEAMTSKDGELKWHSIFYNRKIPFPVSLDRPGLVKRLVFTDNINKMPDLTIFKKLEEVVFISCRFSNFNYKFSQLKQLRKIVFLEGNYIDKISGHPFFGPSLESVDLRGVTFGPGLKLTNQNNVLFIT
jgi:hypothetical protein